MARSKEEIKKENLEFTTTMLQMNQEQKDKFEAVRQFNMKNPGANIVYDPFYNPYEDDNYIPGISDL